MIRPLLFWDVTQCWLPTGYGRFGTAHRSHPIAVGLTDPWRADRAAVPKSLCYQTPTNAA